MRIILSLLALITAVSAQAAEPKKSTKSKKMVIPDRREFPINTEVDPCTDFYKYACSKVNDSFTLPDDRSRHVFSFSDSSERLLEAKKKYFNKLSTAKTESPREAMLKDFYVACMNVPARKSEERAAVKETLKELASIKERQALLDLFAKNRLNGEPTPVAFYTTSNLDRPLFQDVGFGTEWMTLPEKSFYEKPEVVADLEKVVKKFFTDIGAKDADQKAKLVVQFETALAKVYPTPTEFRELWTARLFISRKDLAAKYPNLGVSSLLEKVPESTVIRHLIPAAMDHLNAQLGSMPLEDLKTVYLYEKLRGDLDDAYPAYFKTKFEFDRAHFGGPETRPARNERCTRQVMRNFTPEVDAILWPKIFPNFPSDKIVALSEKIRTAIADSLKDNEWLSSSARKEAIKKMTTAKLQLVAPKTDEEWNFRPMVKYETKKPLANDVAFAKAMIDKDLEELKGPISPDRWYMGPLTINAYYDPSFNKFALPVGILQYPFFDVNGPMEQNLAAIGTVIGHELGHGIDDQGSRFDSEGKLKGWMSDKDLKNFRSRTVILVDQFNKIGHNGDLTLGENIGDLVGLTASYRAAFGKTPSPETKAQRQAFFVSYARAWCGVERPKFAALMLKRDPHARSEARVNQQVMQQAGFKDAFSCKDDAAMVLPKEKIVRLWQ